MGPKAHLFLICSFIVAVIAYIVAVTLLAFSILRFGSRSLLVFAFYRPFLSLPSFLILVCLPLLNMGLRNSLLMPIHFRLYFNQKKILMYKN
jgi:hypothetical protein